MALMLWVEWEIMMMMMMMTPLYVSLLNKHNHSCASVLASALKNSYSARAAVTLNQTV